VSGGDALRAAHRRVWLFVGVLALVALSAGAAVAGAPPVSTAVQVDWWLLALLFVAAEVATVRVYLRRHDYTHSLSEAPLVLGLAFASPLALVTARLVGTALVLGLRLRQPPHKISFNLANLAVETVLGVLVYRWVLGAGPVSDLHGWLAAGAAIGVTTLFGFATLLVVVSLYEGGPQLRAFGWAPVSGIAVAAVNTSIGLLAMFTLTRDPAAVWLVGVVWAIAFFAYRSYGSWRQRHEALARLQTLTGNAETCRCRRPHGASSCRPPTSCEPSALRSPCSTPTTTRARCTSPSHPTAR
jgi:hypothetical protein